MIADKKLKTKSYNRFLTIEQELNSLYKNKYDYSKSIYFGYKKLFTVICPEHGPFTLIPKKHFEGAECPICTDIKNFGHITVSKGSLNTHPDLLKSYLSNKFPNFIFDNFQITNMFTFICKDHGEIKYKNIACLKCKKENLLLNRKSILERLVKNRSERIVSLEFDNSKLECSHGIFTYNNAQLYGNVQLCKECSNKSFNKISQDEFINRVLNRIGDVYDIRNTTYIDATVKISLICKKHGPFELLSSNLLKGQGCSKCTHRVSAAETEILKLIPGAIQSDRTIIKPFELDISTKNFAIEYDGLIWHSSGYNKSSKLNKADNKNGHLFKTELVEAKGLQLFHIFENEWLYHKEKWISVINNKLNTNKKIYARKCSINKIDNNAYKNFCEINHLQGYGIASIKLGLYFNDELISVMSFGKSRYDKSIEYEMIRFCSKLNLSVLGAAGKLLKYFERNYKPKSIVSYANRRWSKGDLYYKLDFKFITNTPPTYFYFKPNENILHNRIKFQKHKLKELLLYDPNLTETENMFANGYRKIFDCGNKKFVKYYEN